MRFLSILFCLCFVSFAFGQADKARLKKTEGDQLYAAQKLEEARAAYEAATKLDPLYTDAWDALGNLQYERGQLDKAIEAYQAGVNADASYAVGRYNVAFCYQKLKQYAKAVDAFRAYLIVSPNDPDGLWGLSSSLDATGDAEKAIAAYESYLRYETRAENKAQREEAQKAITRLKEAKAVAASAKTPEKIETAPAVDLSMLPPKERAKIFLKEGDALVAEKKWMAAAEAYNKATSLDPFEPAAWRSLGDLFFSQDEYMRALGAYQTLATLQTSADLSLRIADCQRLLGKFSEAIASYNALLAKTPEDADALYGLAKALTSSGEKEKAKPIWEKYLRAETRAGKEKQRDEVTALLSSSAAPSSSPVSAPSEEGAKTPAEQLSAKGITPKTPKEAIAAGDMLFGKKEYPLASLAYAQALAFSSANVEAHYKLGVCLAIFGEYEQAISHLSFAVERDPSNKQARERLARVEQLVKLQQPASAPSKDKDTIDVLGDTQAEQRGDLALQEGRYATALAAFEEALGVESKSGILHKKRGDTLLFLGRSEEARQAYLLAITLDPFDAMPYRALGDLYRLRGDSKQARYYYDLFLLRASSSKQAVSAAELGAVKAYLGR